MKYTQDPKIKRIIISGTEGIGKTRIGHELAMFLTRRNMFNAGVYYLNFRNVDNQSDIDIMFKDIGLDYLLNNEIKDQKALQNI